MPDSNAPQPSSPAQRWEGQIAELLDLLMSAQDAMLQLLEQKRRLLVAGDTQQLAELAPREQEVIEQLQACHQKRQQLLHAARDEGHAVENIEQLTRSLDSGDSNTLSRVADARRRARLLQHHSLSNWVLVHRSLLHLSQLLEIIATGGRGQPTYGTSDAAGASGGSLINQAI